MCESGAISEARAQDDCSMNTHLSRRRFLAGAAAVPLRLSASAEGERPTGSGPGDGFAPRELSAMEDAAMAFVAEYQAPALSIAITREGRLAYVKAFGETADSGQKVTPRHRFRIASVSKPITSVAVMGLIEEGRLHLSDRVFGDGSVLGERFGKQPYGSHVTEITIEHLLTHTGGGWSNEGPDPDPMFIRARSNTHQLIAWVLDNMPLRHPPGERFAYSNFGFCVLGRVIEERTGMSYERYLRDHVLRPCGVTGMELAGNRLSDRRRLEVNYVGANGEKPYGMNVARMDAHGGWIATPTDLVRFLVRVDGFATRTDILKPETLRAMTTGSLANTGYAKGWMVNNRSNWWHNGSLPGTTAIMVRTSGGMCWAALTNIRRPGSKMDLDLDRLIWNMVSKVTSWPAWDLFDATD